MSSLEVAIGVSAVAFSDGGAVDVGVGVIGIAKLGSRSLLEQVSR